MRFKIISHVGTEGVTMLGKKCTIRESGKKNLRVMLNFGWSVGVMLSISVVFSAPGSKDEMNKVVLEGKVLTDHSEIVQLKLGDCGSG